MDAAAVGVLSILTNLNCAGIWPRMDSAAVGASGAVSALVIFTVCLSPYSTVLIYGLLPVPAWAFGVLWFATDVYGFLRPVRSHSVSAAVAYDVCCLLLSTVPSCGKWRVCSILALVHAFRGCQCLLSWFVYAFRGCPCLLVCFGQCFSIMSMIT